VYFRGVASASLSNHARVGRVLEAATAVIYWALCEYAGHVKLEKLLHYDYTHWN